MDCNFSYIDLDIEDSDGYVPEDSDNTDDSLWVSNDDIDDESFVCSDNTLIRWFKFTLKPPYTIMHGHQLFGVLPIELLLSNLDSRQLEISPMTSYDYF